MLFCISDVSTANEVLVQALSPTELYCNVSNLDNKSSAVVWWKRKSDGEEFKVISNRTAASTKSKCMISLAVLTHLDIIRYRLYQWYFLTFRCS